MGYEAKRWTGQFRELIPGSAFGLVTMAHEDVPKGFEQQQSLIRAGLWED